MAKMAVTMVCPSARAVTIPALSIVATFGSAVDQRATVDLSCTVPSENVTKALRRPVYPLPLSEVNPLMVPKCKDQAVVRGL